MARFRICLVTMVISSVLLMAWATASEQETQRAGEPRPDTLRGVSISDLGTLVGLTINTDGFQGNFLSTPVQPSLEYPRHSNVEHLFSAGLWIGAQLPDGTRCVSISSQDVNGAAELADVIEFSWDGVPAEFRSDDPFDPGYHPEAVATREYLYAFDDFHGPAGHVPLGVRVETRAMAWDDLALDDGVVLEYTIINQSGSTLHGVHVGYFEDTTVGNTDVNNPYDPGAPQPWNYYDDMNGAWRPGDVAVDPDLWMMYEHDGDGDDGFATSWVGCRLLRLEPAVQPPAGQPPVSYNAWAFRGVPDEDDVYFDGDEELPGKYQLMSNGDFDVGDQGTIDFGVPYNWLAMLSTGPVPELAAGDTLVAAFAVVCGADSTALLDNARAIRDRYAEVWQVVAAPSPSMGLRLDRPAPNPANPGTTIRYELPAGGAVCLSVVALDGRRVRTLVDGVRDAGEHAVFWDGRDDSGRALASGRYLLELSASGAVRSRAVTLVK